MEKRKISIASNNCWRGVTYHFFKSKFYSPFINVFVETDDQFVKLCKKIPSYLNKELILDRTAYNNVEEYEYPVYSLGNIKLHMNHYPDFTEEKTTFEKKNKAF